MHILYLNQHFATPRGTCDGRSYEFSRLLLEQGHRVTMITGVHDRAGLDVPTGPLVVRTMVDGIEVVVVNLRYSQEMPIARRAATFLFFMAVAAFVGCKVRDVDVVYASSTPLTVAVPGVVAARSHGCPFVFEVRDLWPDVPIGMGRLRNPLLRGLARMLERFAYLRAEHIVALSPGMKAGIVSAGIPEGRVTMIPNASDLGLFRVDPAEGRAWRASHPEIGERPLVVYAGAFGRVNDLEYVVRLAAATAAIDPEVAFVLAGEGSEKETVRASARERGVLGRNLFIGDPISRAMLPALLSAASAVSSFALPLPVLEHNSANKFFDGFAAGRPVIVNYRGWQADLLEETGAGLALLPGDPEGSAATLAKAVADPAWLERASKASALLGEERFERRKLSNLLAAVLIGARGGSRA
jgi:glycosyltransferase involved in cell wall biosynthesis